MTILKNQIVEYLNFYPEEIKSNQMVMRRGRLDHVMVQRILEERKRKTEDARVGASENESENPVVARFSLLLQVTPPCHSPQLLFRLDFYDFF